MVEINLGRNVSMVISETMQLSYVLRKRARSLRKYKVVKVCAVLSYGAYSMRNQLNPLSPSIKLQILFLCFHTFLTEVVGRSC